MMNDKTYDLLSDWARIYLPAIAAAYVGVAEIWGLPYAAQISGTIGVAITLMGAFLKKKSKEYFNTGSITFLNPELHEEDEEE